MKQIVTKGIVLSRTNFGEADRIVTLLTPDHGKLRLMAKGVRRVKSKLAGGIELFSISDITFIRGRSEVGTLISSRMLRHYGDIVIDLERVQLGYELIKMMDRITEDHPDPEYFELMEQAFEALNNKDIGLDLIRLWFQAHLLRNSGHQPNLFTDADDKDLTARHKYNFDFDAVAFSHHPEGHFTADHIKFLRLVFSHNKPKTLNQIRDIDKLLPLCQPLVQTMQQTYIRV